MAKIDKLSIEVEVGARICFLRKEKGMSQEELGFEAEVNKNYISDIERGTRNPTLKVLGKIANGLGITLEELFKGIGLNK